MIIGRTLEKAQHVYVYTQVFGRYVLVSSWNNVVHNLHHMTKATSTKHSFLKAVTNTYYSLLGIVYAHKI